jgi:hypothetical protein
MPTIRALPIRLVQATATFPCRHLQKLLGHYFHEFLNAEPCLC